MRKEKKIPQKKANQLPLASMSVNWGGPFGKRSAKHRGIEMKKWKSKARQKANRKAKKGII